MTVRVDVYSHDIPGVNSYAGMRITDVESGLSVVGEHPSQIILRKKLMAELAAKMAAAEVRYPSRCKAGPGCPCGGLGPLRGPEDPA